MRHALFLFSTTVFADIAIFQLSGGKTSFSIGGISTVALLAVPATIYLLACYSFAWISLVWLDRTRPAVTTARDPLLSWILVVVVVTLILGVSGSSFFSIDAGTRQHVFAANPWLPRIVLICLPMAMMAIICAPPSQRIMIFFFMAGFFFMTGSRIHFMIICLTLVSSISDRKIGIWKLLATGIFGLFLLDFLASLRETEAQMEGEDRISLMFSSGHYSIFDIQTILMYLDERLSLRPSYLLEAMLGPFRLLLNMQNVLSSSEYFTLTMAPDRYYYNFSMATVGLSGEMYMIVGWYGTIFVGVFTGAVALMKRFFFWLSGHNKQMEILIRTLGFSYIFLMLRSDMWIFFAYIWLQIPVLIALALYFARTSTRRDYRGKT